jgi:hypothetical protein
MLVRAIRLLSVVIITPVISVVLMLLALSELLDLLALSVIGFLRFCWYHSNLGF